MKKKFQLGYIQHVLYFIILYKLLFDFNTLE